MKDSARKATEDEIADTISNGGLSPREYVKAISYYLGKRRWSQASDAVCRALQEHSRSAELVVIRGDIAAARGDWDRADAEWLGALGQVDDADRITLRRAWGVIRSGSRVIGNDHLIDAIARVRVPGQKMLAETLVRVGEHEWSVAERRLSQADLQIGDPVAAYARLMVGLGIEKPEEAIAASPKAITLLWRWCPEAETAAVAQFYRCLAKGLPVEADLATRLHRFPIVALRATEWVSDTEEAAGVIQAALESNPNHPTLLAELARIRPTIDVLVPGMRHLGHQAPAEVVEAVNSLSGSQLGAPFVRRMCDARASRRIELVALGGAETIGASCYALKVGGRTILLDCGLDPRHRGPDAYPDLDKWQGDVDAVVISHGHLDHCGALPKVHDRWPSASLFCTEATKQYASVLFSDMLNIQQAQLEREREREVYADSLQAESVLEAVRELRVLSFDEWATPFEGCRLRLLPAGHILGAAIVEIEWGDLRIVYTGDFCLHHQGLTAGAQVDAVRPEIDLLICEATYASRPQVESWDEQMSRLVKAASGVLERGGNVLFPSFAIGRSQELVSWFRRLILDDQLPSETMIWVAGLAARACSAAELALQKAGAANSLALARPPCFWTSRFDELPVAGTIVIASSGMLIPGSASSRYASLMRDNPANGIFFPGYLDEESDGIREFRTDTILAETGRFGLSAHAGPDDLVHLAKRLEPRAVVLVHWGSQSRRRRLDFVEGLRHELNGDCLSQAAQRGRVTRPCDPADWLSRRLE